jgi:hypothetical protein
MSDFEGVGVYVASRASIPARGEMWRKLRSLGHAIISTWIDEDGPGQTASMAELWPRIVKEIQHSSGLVLYIEPGDLPLKGAFIEAGIALAFDKEIRIVAPNIPSKDIGSWLNHPRVRFSPTPEVAIAYLNAR